MARRPPIPRAVGRRRWLVRIAALFHQAGETEIAGWLVARSVIVQFVD